MQKSLFGRHTEEALAYDEDFDLKRSVRERAAPPGTLEPRGQSAPPEFYVGALWDGMAFSGLIIDRRPALTGGTALLYSIPVSVSGSRITLTVPAALAAQVRAAVVLPGASWNCLTVRADGPMGSVGVHRTDTVGRQPWPQ